MSEPTETVSEARDAAFRLLSSRARTEQEIRRRLRKKGFAGEVVEEVVAWLLERDFLDDEGFCRTYVEERIRRRPRGRFALVQELRKRGVDRGLAERAVEEAMERVGVDEAELARAAARGWLEKQSREDRRNLAAGEPADAVKTLRRRLYGYLERRGFSRSLSRRTLEAVVSALDGE